MEQETLGRRSMPRYGLCVVIRLVRCARDQASHRFKRCNSVTEADAGLGGRKETRSLSVEYDEQDGS